MATVHRKVHAGLVLLAAATVGACGGGSDAGSGDGGVGGITISPQVPHSLTATTLQGAAEFAWNEFIALNWPAVPQTGSPGTRDVADTNAKFGVPGDPTPLVWHTFRSKVEIFPKNGLTPNGYIADSTVSYGYDSLPRYYPWAVQQTDTATPPWINLDETNEIGLDAMYAGVGAGQAPLNGLILFTAKANRAEYTYVAANQYYDSATAVGANQTSTAYVVKHKRSPAPGTSADGVSLPTGTIEMKAAWRGLTAAEAASGRFYQTRVRYYPTPTTYRDTTMGLVGLHIIQKTRDQPHFVFATFEQADNILSRDGVPVEDEQGNLTPGYDTLPPMDTDPALVDTSATNPAPNGYAPGNIQRLGPDTVTSRPGSRLYYVNTPGTGESDGIVTVNRRVRGIPPEIVAANEAAHAAMTEYAAANGLPPSVWQFYKLINVQYRPIDKPQAGVAYTGADSATYYQANIVVETDKNLQTFSGRFQPGFSYADTIPVTVEGLAGTTVQQVTASVGNRITDWCGSNPTKPIPGCPAAGNGPIHNVYTGGTAYNMGGCMGCHGNAQVQGGDFSFLLIGGPVNAPEPADAERAPLNTQKYREHFGEVRSVRAAARASPPGTQ